MSQLKPCPFCGNVPEVIYYNKRFNIECCIVHVFKQDEAEACRAGKSHQDR